jgi:pyruvate-ferredoxin/flavodoxin oxidoreductase
MGKVSALTGRTYNLFDYVGAPDAEKVIVSMGSSCETIEEVVDYLNGQGEKLGLVKVRLFRPFSAEHLVSVIPAKAPRSLPFSTAPKSPAPWAIRCTMDVCTAFMEQGEMPKIVNGRYGLGSKEFNPSMVKAVFDNMNGMAPRNHFTVGITDDVTHTSLEVEDRVSTWLPKARSSASSGAWAPTAPWAPTRAPSRSSATTPTCMPRPTLPTTPKRAAASPSPTCVSARRPSVHLPDRCADYIACHNPAYVQIYDVLDGIKDGGTFMLNSPWRLKTWRPSFRPPCVGPSPKKAQILQHRRGQDRRGSGTGRTHQHDHADSVFQSGQRDPGGRSHRLPQRPDQKAVQQKKRQDRQDEQWEPWTRPWITWSRSTYPDSWADATW